MTPDESRFAQEFLSPGERLIDPERFAAALQLRGEDLASLAGVDSGTVADSPANDTLQRFLRAAVRILSLAFELTHDRDRTIFWFRNSPIPEFSDQTAAQLVAQGQGQAVARYLRSIAGGSSG